MATTKRDLVVDYLNRLNLAVTNWDAYVINPFASAYDEAFNNYKSVLDAQAKADQERIELLFVGLSLLGGTMATAMIGKAAITAVMKEVAVSTICNLNMQRTFRIAAMLEASPAGSFAVAGLVEAGSKFLTDQAKETIKAGVPRADAITRSNTPLSVYLAMLRILKLASSKAQTAALDIQNNNTSLDEARRAIAILDSAAIMRAPKKDIYDPKLAGALELIMYLNLVMTRDELVTREYDSEMRRLPRVVSRSPISAAPGSSAYPKGANLGGMMVQRVEVDALGGKVNTRMNKLYRDFFGKDLVDNGLFANSLTPQNMREAFGALHRLSTQFAQPELKLAA